MERNDKKLWLKLLGFDPNKELKVMILGIVRDEGITLAEACSRYAMPPLQVEGVNDTEPSEYDNPYRPPIIIKARKY